MANAEKGRTRRSLQQDCVLPPMNSKNLDIYFNMARQLLVQGESYYREQDLRHAYVYFKRFLGLATHKIFNHSKIHDPKYSNQKLRLKEEWDRIFKVLTEVSSRLDKMDAEQAHAGGGGRGGAGYGTTSRKEWHDDDFPEVPTGPVSAGAKKSLDSVLRTEPSAPSAPDDHGGWAHGGNGVTADEGGSGVHGGDGVGDVGGSGLGRQRSERSGIGLEDVFRKLSLDQGKPAAGSYPDVNKPRYMREHPSMRLGERTASLKVKRKVVLPRSLVEHFEEIARPNTQKEPYGIETCGILAGRVTRNVLNMTSLIIPKQEGTSDSVATTDETGLFNYMLANKLITLGWIHTHPMQDCFLSSVDLHTHCGYQLMLPEAVAVVYAPRDEHRSVGVFRLTDPGGMKLIQACKLTGFHVHPDGIKIYEEALLEWSEHAHVDIVDLR